MLEGITEGMICGMKKGYEKHNWKKGLPINEAHLAAAIRHIYKYMDGDDFNVETAVDGSLIHTHHLDNALTHLAMAVHQIKSNRTDLDDREPKDWLADSPEALAAVEEGLKQAKEATGKPLNFKLQDDSLWLSEPAEAFTKGKAAGYKHDWGFDVKRDET
jgi:hypothetical protein